MNSDIIPSYKTKGIKMEQPAINRQIFEIRYRAEPRILDHRGVWADQLLDLLAVTEWRIDPIRLDVLSKDKRKSVFISYKNAGIVLHNSNEKEFSELTSKFLGFLFRQSPFRNIALERLGVLLRAAKKSDGNFESIVQLYQDKFIAYSSNLLEVFNGRIIDVGTPVTLETDIGKINFRSGPMPKEQLTEMFESEDELPETAIFFECDYFLKPEINSTMNTKQIPNLVRDYIHDNWARCEKFFGLLNK